MAYQFVRIETYCPKPMPVPHSDDQFNSTEQVFLEAERDERYAQHVPDPEPPIPIIGFGSIPVAQLRKLHDTRRAKIRETVTNPDGTTYQRGLKSDFPTLYTEIHSHPMTAADYKAASREEKGRVQRWAKLALSDFAKRMPQGVEFAAVLHLDEGHVHFHILAVNMADPKLSANKLHAGKIAAEEWRRSNGHAETLTGLPKPMLQARPNKPKKPKPSKTPATQKKRDAAHGAAVAEWESACGRIEAENTAALEAWKAENNVHLRKLRKERKGKAGDIEAYETALAAFQDRYYETVGKRCGLLRKGPGTERLSSKQYHARKGHARTVADQEAAMKTTAARQGAERAQIIADTNTMVREKAMIAHQEGEVDAMAQALAEREFEMSRREAALRAAEDSLKKKEHKQAEKEKTLAGREVETEQRDAQLNVDHERFAQQKQTFEREITERVAVLDGWEQAIAVQVAEVNDAVAALADMVEQFERGHLRLDGDRIVFDRHHPFLRRAATTERTQLSPVQRLAVRFVRVLKSALVAMSGGRDAKSEVTEDRPEI